MCDDNLSDEFELTIKGEGVSMFIVELGIGQLSKPSASNETES